MPIPTLAARFSLPLLLFAATVTLPALPALGKDEAPAKATEKPTAADAQSAVFDLAKKLEEISPQSVVPEAKTKAMIKVTGKDGKLADAELTAVDAGGYSFASKENPAGRQTWFATGSASTANDILKKAVDPKDAGQNILAARILVNLKMGAPTAEFYLKQAAAANKELAKTPIKQLQAAVLDLAIADYNRLKPDWAWPRLTTAQHDERIEELGRAIRTDAAKVGLKFPLSDQSEHFIFYTDADLTTARLWARKLEGAYERLCKTFDLDPRQNVWQGKCAVVLCRNQANYLKWMGAVAKDFPMAQKSAGLSISGSVFAGSNSIQFFHDPGNVAYVESTLNHELSHAFTAQFHGNHYLHSWINEGLAEYVSSNGKGHEFKTQASHEKIRATGSLEDFFSAKNIDFRHYGAAFEMTSLLIKKNPRGYARFVKAVTEGQDPADAFKEHCNLTFDQLAAAYAKMLGMRALRSH